MGRRTRRANSEDEGDEVEDEMEEDIALGEDGNDMAATLQVH